MDRLERFGVKQTWLRQAVLKKNQAQTQANNNPMFDLKFYASVSHFVKYMQSMMHDALPNAAGYNKTTIKKYFEEKVCIISILAQTSYWPFHLAV